jgi:hypothetical protein
MKIDFVELKFGYADLKILSKKEFCLQKNDYFCANFNLLIS